MRKLILATAFILSSSAAFAGFTAQVSGDNGSAVGGFQSLAQCQAFVKGLGGTCIDNGSWMNSQARFVEPASQSIVIETNNPHR